MSAPLPLGSAMREMALAALRWLAGWLRIVLLGAEILALAFSPASYRGERRARLLAQIYRATAPSLLWFTVLTSLLSLVLIRIVVVTAQSYGLSQYALEMVVRVLVLELIPLIATLFVAVRYSVPRSTELYEARASASRLATDSRVGALAPELLPSVLAGMVAVITLAALSCLVSLVLAYLTVYGFTTAAFLSYTRTVGQVFNPAVTLILSLKTVFFSLAVSLVPISVALQAPPRSGLRPSLELHGLIRMFVVLLAVEVAALVVNYY